MFTGIVQGVGEIVGICGDDDLRTFEIVLPEGFDRGLERGASVAVNGVCLTATTRQDASTWCFDVMLQSLRTTNLSNVAAGRSVNLERAATADAEVGGHILSGHVDFVSEVAETRSGRGNKLIRFSVPRQYMPYIFARGHIAIDGISLTIAETSRIDSWFEIWLIPETRRATIIDEIGPGYRANIEIERSTQVVVDTVRDTVNRALDERFTALEAALSRAGLDRDTVFALDQPEEMIETVRKAISRSSRET
ncbi:MAG: riboflavin synthase subunit alpha [Boseongicola sp. SB0677_bin_26]|nr:riboflavin synthase subunit alpha [Boseongicola sp. SB0665_bin_10]MYG27993.1 riboflavin synthase subunit alpha [Boseongicola sp. SB0677_bin_26]